MYEKDKRHYLIAKIKDTRTAKLLELVGVQSLPVSSEKIMVIFLDYNQEDKIGHMNSAFFECGDFLDWVSGCSGPQDLRTKPEVLEPPTQFNYETWHMIDGKFNWQLKEKTIVTGVKWLSAKHSDPNTMCCAGMVTFSYENYKTTIVEDGPIVEILYNTKYPAHELTKCIKEKRYGYT